MGIASCLEGDMGISSCLDGDVGISSCLEKRKSKQTYYGKLLTEYRKDIRKTWQALNTIINRTTDKSNIADNFIIENTTTDDPQINADGLHK